MPDPRSKTAARWKRLWARLIDGAISAAIFLIAVALIIVLYRKMGLSLDTSITISCISGILLLLVVLIVQCILLALYGQTIGKRILRIKIVRADTGRNAGFVRNVFLRSFLNALLSVIPFYALVDALAIASPKNRCIHDHIAGTVVVNA
jgi:uncharacterized RDD family membrane protein YckC